MQQQFVPPKLNLSAFNCPYCDAYAKQDFYDALYEVVPGRVMAIPATRISICAHCRKFAIWFGPKMIWPSNSPAPLPHQDLPEAIAVDYNEARQVFGASPRGAAALLRLCIQKLCIHFGEPGKDLNADIGALVKKGLNPKIQKSLDVVRVIGNEAVHPGTIDLSDQPETALELFKLVNIIVETMISQPKAIDELFKSLPETKRAQIEKRDSRK
jgi:hypothetical protein